jgi:hypothetical protein
LDNGAIWSLFSNIKWFWNSLVTKHLADILQWKHVQVWIWGNTHYLSQSSFREVLTKITSNLEGWNISNSSKFNVSKQVSYYLPCWFHRIYVIDNSSDKRLRNLFDFNFLTWLVTSTKAKIIDKTVFMVKLWKKNKKFPLNQFVT